MKPISILKPFTGLLILVFFLNGCTSLPMDFSPQQAAIRALAQQGSRNSIIDQTSIQVRQSVDFGQQTFVLISYAQVTGVRQEKCLATFEMEKGALGLWRPNSSGGGCSGTVVGSEPPPEQPVESGSGSSSSSGRSGIGYSQVNGLVNQEDITTIRVTWMDGQTQEVDVINGSFLAVRAGRQQFQKVEGLNSAGDTIYSNAPEIAPGKE